MGEAPVGRERSDTAAPRRGPIVMFSPGRSERGGAPRRSRFLASELAGRGWRVRVITKADNLYRFRVHREPNLTVFEVPGFRSRIVGALAFLLVGVPLGLAWGRGATVFVSVQLVSPTTAAAICSGLLRRPYIALTSTSGALSEATYLLSRRSSWLRRRLLGRAAFLCAQTEAAAAELGALVEPGRIVVLPNPVASVVPPPLRGTPSALYTGRLSEEKDLFHLLSAWREIAGSRPDALLTLAGDGGFYRSVEDELRRVVAEDEVLRSCVRFTGWVPDVEPLLADADVFVLPSRTEGMSNSLLEACAWHRVVVASDIPSNRAILGDDYPLLVKPGDTESLTLAIERSLEDETTRDQALYQISNRISAFSVENVVNQFEHLISASTSEHVDRLR